MYFNHADKKKMLQEKRSGKKKKYKTLTLKNYVEQTTYTSCPVSTVEFSSVTQSCPSLCDPMDCSTPGLPVHLQLPEFTQTHVH